MKIEIRRKSEFVSKFSVSAVSIDETSTNDLISKTSDAIDTLQIESNPPSNSEFENLVFLMKFCVFSC